MFVNDIELKEEDSKNEQKWVSTMLVLFSVQWFIFAILNMISGFNNRLGQRWQRRAKDIGVGAILGSILVQVLYYG
jgi:hypothetical protein